MTSEIPTVDSSLSIYCWEASGENIAPNSLVSLLLAMGKLIEMPIIWSDRKVKPKNPRVNDHGADMTKVVRTTNLKRSGEVPLLEKKLIDIKPPDNSTALLLSQRFVSNVGESDSASCGLQGRAGGTASIRQLE